jgi:hypothetical protein
MLKVLESWLITLGKYFQSFLILRNRINQTSFMGSSQINFLIYGTACLPVGVLLCWLAKYVVNVPFFDSWMMGVYFYGWKHDILTLESLFEQHNESRKFFPRLILLGLAELTHWNTIYEVGLTVFFLLLILLGLNRLLKFSIPHHPKLVAVATAVIATFLCSPLQYENLLWGLQYIMFVTPACLVGMLLLMRGDRPRWQIFLIMVSLAWFATFTFANGMTFWLISLIPIGFKIWQQPNRKAWAFLLAWLTCFSGTLIFYFHGYVKPPDSPSLLSGLEDPLKLVQYFLSFLGAPLSFSDQQLAQILGGFALIAFVGGVAVYAWSAWQRFQKSGDRSNFHSTLIAMIPWLSLGSYSLLSGTITSLGRVGFGIEQAFSPRYITVSNYLWVAITGLIVTSLGQSNLYTLNLYTLKPAQGIVTEADSIITSETSSRADFNSLKVNQFWRWFSWGAAFLLGLWLILESNSYRTGLGGMQILNRQLRLGKACVTLSPVVYDSFGLQQVHPNLQLLRQYLRPLNDLGVINPPLIETPNLAAFGSRDLAGVAEGQWDSWTWESKVVLKDRQRPLSHPELPHWVAKGWAILRRSGRSADVVILAARDPKTQVDRPIALAWVTESRPDVARKFGADFRVSGWQAAFTPQELPAEPTELSAWAFDTNQARAYRLPNRFWWPGREAVETPGSKTQKASAVP